MAPAVPPQVVAKAGVLHLDDICPKVAEDLAAKRASKDGGSVYNAQTLEWPRAWLRVHRPLPMRSVR